MATEMRLPHPLYRQLREFAEAGIPREVCGLLSGSNGEVKRLYPIPNVAETPETRFVLAPDAFLRAYYTIERSGEDLLAVFHSHPRHAPNPSSTDIAETTWPDLLTVIAGPVADEFRIAAWSLRARQPIPVALRLV
jgi:proteasome lid subunit RPN8/RPN11